jgi:intron-binding protein aquarius
VLGRKAVFETVFELQPAFEKLFARPTELALVTGEMFPAQRALDDDVDSTVMTGVEHLGQYVFEMTKAKVQQIKEGSGMLPPPDAAVEVEGDESDEDEDMGAAVEEEDGGEQDIDEEKGEGEEEGKEAGV